MNITGQKTLEAKLCGKCWNQASMPEVQEIVKFRFLTDPNYR